MIYNIALTFNKETNTQIYNYYKTIKSNLDIEFDLKPTSIPHITVLKFETSENLTQKELTKLTKELNTNDFEINLSGLTFLPSHLKGCWIEISILKNIQIIELQTKLINKLNNKYKILNGINNKFRPHITLAKTKDNKINIINLNQEILRKKEIKTQIQIGTSDNTFEYLQL